MIFFAENNTSNKRFRVFVFFAGKYVSFANRYLSSIKFQFSFSNRPPNFQTRDHLREERSRRSHGCRDRSTAGWNKNGNAGTWIRPQHARKFCKKQSNLVARRAITIPFCLVSHSRLVLPSFFFLLSFSFLLLFPSFSAWKDRRLPIWKRVDSRDQCVRRTTDRWLVIDWKRSGGR